MDSFRVGVGRVRVVGGALDKYGIMHHAPSYRTPKSTTHVVHPIYSTLGVITVSTEVYGTRTASG
jgi:hypothetical protein